MFCLRTKRKKISGKFKRRGRMTSARENILIQAIRETKDKDRDTVINKLSGAFAEFPHIGDHALDKLGRTPLIIAVQEQNEWAVEWLLDKNRLGTFQIKNPRVNYLDHNKMSALMYAVQLQYPDADFDEEKIQTNTAIQKRIIKLLLQHDANPWNIEVLKEKQETFYNNALFEAAKSNNIEFLEFFFQNYWKDINENMNVEDRYIIQCLLMNWAVKHNNQALIRLLTTYTDIGKRMLDLRKYSLDWGSPSPFSSKDSSIFTREIALGYEDSEISQFKFHTGDKMPIPYIFSAIKTDNIELARLLLKENLANADTDDYYKTDPNFCISIYPLNYVIQRLHEKKLTLEKAIQFIELLIEYGAEAPHDHDDPDVLYVSYDLRDTIIYQVTKHSDHLSFEDRFKILKILMEKANLKKFDHSKNFQVDFAIERKHYDLAKYLLSVGYPPGKLKINGVVPQSKSTKLETKQTEEKKLSIEPFSLNDLNKVVELNNATSFKELIQNNKPARDLVKEKCDEILCDALNKKRNNIVKELIPYYDPIKFEEKGFGFFAKLWEFFGFINPSKVLNAATKVGNIDAVKQVLAKGATLSESTFDISQASNPRVKGYLEAVRAIRKNHPLDASKACQSLNDDDKRDLYLLCLANAKQRELVEKIVGDKIVDSAFEMSYLSFGKSIRLPSFSKLESPEKSDKEHKDTAVRVLSLMQGIKKSESGAVYTIVPDESKRSPLEISFQSDHAAKPSIFKTATLIEIPDAAEPGQTLTYKT